MTWLHALLACSALPPAPGVGASGQSGRIREPNLQVTDLEVGGTAQIRVTFGTPGEVVRVYSGTRRGAGPCYFWLQGGCLGIRSPTAVSNGVVAADGTAQFQVAVVPNLAVGDVRVFQAVVGGAPPSLSNTVHRVVHAVGSGVPPLGSNVLVVLLDDVGRDKLALYGSPNPAPTPVIDALAAEGVTFDNAYSRPLCVSGRASLQTGRHGRRTGVAFNWNDTDPWELGLEQITLPEMVALSPFFSYTNAYVGKWHLGSEAAASGLEHPARQGWQNFAGSFANMFVPRSGYDSYFDWEKTVNGTQSRSSVYATTDTVDDALDRMATMPEPWLLVVSLNAAHAPFEEPPAALMPVLPAAGDGLEARKLLAAADTEIGRMFSAVDPGVLERTTVFLTADNGTYKHQTQDPVDRRRAKGTLFDGGVRVPMIVAGVGVGAPGTRSDAFVDLVDLYPTIAEIAGVDLEGLTSALDPSRPYVLDGVSLLRQLSDPTRPTSRQYLYSEQFAPLGGGPYTEVDRQMIRDERYKLIVDNLSGLHLFFEYENPRAEEGLDLLACGLTAEQQEAYDRLLAALADQTAALVYDAEPFVPGIGVIDYPVPDDTGLVVCELADSGA